MFCSSGSRKKLRGQKHDKMGMGWMELSCQLRAKLAKLLAVLMVDIDSDIVRGRGSGQRAKEVVTSHFTVCHRRRTSQLPDDESVRSGRDTMARERPQF